MMSMDMLQWTAQTKSHHQVHQQGTGITVLTHDDVIDPHLTITIMIGTIAVIIKIDIDQDLTPIIIDTGVTVAVTHTEVTPDHITKCISLPKRHPTQKALLTQKFFQGLQ